jgi:hypothetical protein
VQDFTQYVKAAWDFNEVNFAGGALPYKGAVTLPVSGGTPGSFDQSGVGGLGAAFGRAADFSDYVGHHFRLSDYRGTDADIMADPSKKFCAYMVCKQSQPPGQTQQYPLIMGLFWEFASASALGLTRGLAIRWQFGTSSLSFNENFYDYDPDEWMAYVMNGEILDAPDYGRYGATINDLVIEPETFVTYNGQCRIPNNQLSPLGTQPLTSGFGAPNYSFRVGEVFLGQIDQLALLAGTHFSETDLAHLYNGGAFRPLNTWA